MSNPRIRTAVLAFFLGTLGVDMLMLRSQQVRLFLLLGAPLLAIAVLCGILAATSNGSWMILSGAALIFLQFWAIARFFEALSHTNESFNRLLDGSGPSLADQVSQMVELGTRPSA